MADGFSYSADNDRKFRDALQRAGAAVRDLTIPLTLISKDFYKSERAIWQLQSAGQYPDLKESTKKDRIRRGQPIYPILRRSGALERSVTDPTDANAVNFIVNGRSLVIGTRAQNSKDVPYPIFHQRGTSKMAMRKFLFIGPEAPRWAVGDQVGRLERWLGILDGYMKQKITFGHWSKT